ncbi:hypothetical protein [Burkholderia sp. Bp9031]|uniref:hypothetical protein n=1 Tax=Burkholderia sp. Bp9031 TaxID=2184566 RepID=UPI000F5DE47E|nr:hypothetical protein [Burkholderia sp. Bp9031]
MNSQTRSISLPGVAALVAAAVIAVLFLYSLYVRSTMFPLATDVLAVLLANCIQSLVFRAGLVFLIVRWHGERRGQLAFRRPAPMLTIYGLCLLVWQVAQTWLFRTLMVSLTNDSAKQTFIVTITAPLNAALYALVAWLAWRFVTRMFRNDAFPMAPPDNAAWRIAGLAAWLFASVLLFFMTQAVPLMLDYYDDDFNLVMLNFVGAVVVPAALVCAGAKLGVPRDLGRLHVWRFLGASLAAMVSVLLLGYGTMRILGIVSAAINLMSGMLTITILAGICLAYRISFRAFYAAVRGQAAEPSQGMQSP